MYSLNIYFSQNFIQFHNFLVPLLSFRWRRGGSMISPKRRKSFSFSLFCWLVRFVSEFSHLWNKTKQQEKIGCAFRPREYFAFSVTR
jgi:hypothetical protein